MGSNVTRVLPRAQSSDGCVLADGNSTPTRRSRRLARARRSRTDRAGKALHFESAAVKRPAQAVGVRAGDENDSVAGASGAAVASATSPLNSSIEEVMPDLSWVMDATTGAALVSHPAPLARVPIA